MPYVTIMTERGFDNVFLLSGGMQEFMQAYPQCLDGKNIPVIDPPKNFQKKSKVEVYRQGQAKNPKENQ